MINIALVGFGHWGPKLLSNFWHNKNFNFVSLAETNPQRQKIAKQLYPNLKIYDEITPIIDDGDINALIIACKVKDHYHVAKKALLKGKHVLIEKPICASSLQAEDLIKIASKKRLTLMVDHILIFDSAVKKIKQLYDQNYFGKVTYYDATRANLGLFQTDVSALWDLGPHDLAVMDYLFDEAPLTIEANGFCHVNPNLNDVANLTLHFASNKTAVFKFSWVWPFKQRTTLIRGDKNTAFWNDSDTSTYKLSLYNSGLKFKPQKESKEVIIPEYVHDDIKYPKLDQIPALVGVSNHFADVIRGRCKSLMDGNKGLRMLKILEEAEKQINQKIAIKK